MVSDDAVFPRTQPFNRSLRSKIEWIRPKSDDAAVESIEGMCHKKQLARWIDVRPLSAAGVPSVPDFDTPDILQNVVKASAADDGAAGEIYNRPRKHRPLTLAFKSVSNVRFKFRKAWDESEPQIPKISVGSSQSESLGVFIGERLEPNAVSFQDNRLNR